MKDVLIKPFKLGDIGPVCMCKRILKEETAPSGEIPFYKIGTFGKTADAYISRARYQDYKARFSFPKKGDILLSAAGTIGRLVVYDGEDAYYQDSNIVWVKNDETQICNQFLYYALRRVKWPVSQGSTILRLYNDDVRNVIVYAPVSLHVQGRISRFLSSLDDKIALNRKKIEKMEALAKTIYDYWFVQFDFPDANGRPYKSSGGKMVYNPILKREIPDGWEVVPFSQCIDFTMGQSPTGETLNETKNGTLFYQGATDFGTYFPTPRQYTTKPIRMAKAGDILLSVRAPVGTVNIADSECCIGRGLGAFRSRRTRKGSLFVWLYLKGLETYFARKNSVGTTFGSIGKEDFALLPVLKPDELLIEEFEGIDKHLMGEMMVANNEIRNLTSLRDFLLPLLMNGQVEVDE